MSGLTWATQYLYRKRIFSDVKWVMLYRHYSASLLIVNADDTQLYLPEAARLHTSNSSAEWPT